MLNTNLTVKQIQYCLRHCGIWKPNTDLMVPNVSYGLLSYEADFIIMTPNGYLTEIEIKRSFEDFKADFKKEHRHNDEKIYHFYFCVPEIILDKVKSYLDKTYLYPSNIPALLTYNELGYITKQKYGYSGAYRNEKPRKLFLEEQLKLAKLAAFRYWSIEEKTTGVEIANIREAYKNKTISDEIINISSSITTETEKTCSNITDINIKTTEDDICF